jgi:hypothetical protein
VPAVATQQLAQIADLDQGPATSALRQALAMFDDASKNTYLRRASARVLAAYGKRFNRATGASFTLAKWGDLTIGMVCVIARWEMISDRGYNPALPADKTIRDRYDEAEKELERIADITNANARIDPDAVGMPDADDMGFQRGRCVGASGRRRARVAGAHPVSGLDAMIARIEALAHVPERAAVMGAEGLQSSMDRVSSAKGRAQTGTADPTDGGIAIHALTGGAEFVSDAWETIIADGIDAAFAEVAQ